MQLPKYTTQFLYSLQNIALAFRCEQNKIPIEISTFHRCKKCSDKLYIYCANKSSTRANKKKYAAWSKMCIVEEILVIIIH